MLCYKRKILYRYLVGLMGCIYKSTKKNKSYDITPIFTDDNIIGLAMFHQAIIFFLNIPYLK